jgi:hypothetical protein
MRPSPPLGTTGETEYSPGGRWRRAGGRPTKLVNLLALATEKTSRSTTRTWAKWMSEPPDPRPQQRAAVPRASSTPGAGPSWPRANQARTPREGRNSARDSGQAAEAAKAALNWLLSLRRMAGSRTEAVAFLIGSMGAAWLRPTRKLAACPPAAGPPASGLSRRWCAASHHRGRIATQHRPRGPAGVLPPLPAAPGPEAAPGPQSRPRPRHLLRPLA